IATASRPFCASPMTWMSRAAPSTALRPARTTVWSSASTTRIEPSLILSSSLGVPERARQWNGGGDARALTRRALDVEPPARERDAFPHREQPHSRPASLGVRDVETGAVIADLENRGAVAFTR